MVWYVLQNNALSSTGKFNGKPQAIQKNAVAKIPAEQLAREHAITEKRRVEDQQKKQVRNRVSVQEAERFNALQVQAQSESQERELEALFDAQYIPSPECENPSGASFVRCVNDRRRARLAFFEINKLN